MTPGSCLASPTCAVHNTAVDGVRFARSARKHKVGKAHAMHVIKNNIPRDVPAGDEFDARKVWLGADDRGVDLEIVAVVLPYELLIIHVMPSGLRRKL